QKTKQKLPSEVYAWGEVNAVECLVKRGNDVEMQLRRVGSTRDQPITDTGLGNNQFRAGWVSFDFVAQMSNVNAQVMSVLIMSGSRDFTKDLAMREDFASMADEEAKEVIFGDAELEFAAIYGHATGSKISE